MNTRPPHTRRRMFHRDSDWQHSLKRDRIIASWTIYMRYKLTHLNDIHLFARIAQSLSLSSSNPLPFGKRIVSVLMIQFVVVGYTIQLWVNCGWYLSTCCWHSSHASTSFYSFLVLLCSADWLLCWKVDNWCKLPAIYIAGAQRVASAPHIETRHNTK